MIQLGKEETRKKSGKAPGRTSNKTGEFGADYSTTLSLPSPLPRVSSSTDVQDAVPTIATACPLVSFCCWTFALAAATWNDCQG